MPHTRFAPLLLGTARLSVGRSTYSSLRRQTRGLAASQNPGAVLPWIGAGSAAL